MEDVSILDQIISDQKIAEVNNMDTVKIVGDLFSELSDREQDVLKHRHGLKNGTKKTLEGIGKDHNLTRERIRQIETSSIKKLQELKNLDEYLKALRKVISQLLEEHGGIMEKEYLKNALVGFSIDSAQVEVKDKEVHKNYINFLITKLLHKEFEDISSSKYFKSFYKFKHQNIDLFENIVNELLDKVRELKKIHKTKDIISLIKNTESYKANEEKFQGENNIDMVGILRSKLYDDEEEFINDNKVVYSILQATEKLKQNKFGYWGYNNWKEITPKTINDKIFLVLKNKKKPMHFEEIATRINEVGFDKKNANPATVHNELILDKKYVLVGRGLYGLKDWGYKEGSVVDVVKEILNESDEPLTRDQIIRRVLDKRVVKKATIILALMNKDKFERKNDKYLVKIDY